MTRNETEFVITVGQSGNSERFTRSCHGRVVLGRGDDVDVQLAHPAISRRHAEIDVDDETGAFTITDLGSRNGTSVNGERISGAKQVSGGDIRVELGPYTLVLSLPATFSETIDFSAWRKGRQVVLASGTHSLEIDGKEALARLAGL